MSGHAEPPHVDTQSLGDAEAGLYETIATLEYAGHKATRAEIAAASGRDEAAVDEQLAAMTARGLVVLATAGGETVYAPARRGWSTEPGKTAGPRISGPAGRRRGTEPPSPLPGRPQDRPAPAGQAGADFRPSVEEPAVGLIKIDETGGSRIEGWTDDGGIAVITWRGQGPGTYQQELANQQEAIALLDAIARDDTLTLISAQLRRRGTGPSG
jgi:hypothetical protein